LWFAFRCRVLLSHRWRRLRVANETYFECRDCRKRYFGSHPPEGDERALWGGGGPV
jgi:hypothetical protein